VAEIVAFNRYVAPVAGDVTDTVSCVLSILKADDANVALFPARSVAVTGAGDHRSFRGHDERAGSRTGGSSAEEITPAQATHLRVPLRLL
jgi:hypothetical protein